MHRVTIIKPGYQQGTDVRERGRGGIAAVLKQ